MLRRYVRASVHEDVSDEIMVFREAGQVVVSASLDADERDAVGIECPESFTVPDGDQPVTRSMQDIYGAANIWYPLVGPQVISKHPAHGQEREEPLHDL